MAGNKVLVLGATGPAGICVLRELLHCKVATLAFCRSPRKIPKDLADNALLEIIKGDLSTRDDLSAAVAQSRAIISLLGPGSESQPRSAFADYYRTIVPLMKKHGPHDRFSTSRAFTAALIRLVANGGYQNILAIQEYFETVKDPQVEWTVFRLGMLSGTSDAAAWSVDRTQGEAYAGPVGVAGYSAGVNRSVLAKWLVDESLTQSTKWAHEMPAVSTLK